MTVQTLRPNNVQFTSAPVAVGGGGTTLTAVNDNSDATYDRGLSNGAYIAFNFPAMTPLSAAQRVKSLTTRLRCAMDLSTGHVETCKLSTNLVPALPGDVGVWYAQRVATSILTLTGAVAYLAPGNQPWTEALVNTCRVNVQWQSTPVPEFLRVHELYLDVDVNNQPVVTGTPVVTNFTNNARPTITWVYNDVDGDPQSAYRIKVFDSTVYSTANFNPDISSAVFDSGDLHSGAATFIITKDLQNAVTYKAYVKVAQDWLIGQDTLWWSDWADSSPFTITFVPPVAPTLTVSMLAGELSYRASIAVSAPVNLLAADDASFETALGLWVADSNCSIARSTTNPADGIGDMQMTSAGGAGGALPATHVQTAVSAPSGAATTVVQAFGSNNVAGNLLVAAISWDSTSVASVTGVTDTRGNTWVVLATSNEPTNKQAAVIAYALNCAAGANTVTATLAGSTGDRRIAVSEYSGILTAAAFDVQSGNNGLPTTATDNVTSGAATTTGTNGDLVYGVVMSSSGATTITAGTGFNQRGMITDFAVQDKAQNPAGSVASTNTFSAVHRYVAAMATFKAVAIGGGSGGDMLARDQLDALGNPLVKGGAQYTALASFRSAVTARSCAVGVRWLDINLATISTVFGSSVTDGTAGYIQASFTGNAPGNAAHGMVVVKVIATAAAEVHRVDKVDLHAGSSTVWTPGGNANQLPGIILERGERVDDHRGPAENWAHPQVASAGSVLRDASYGFNIDTTLDNLTWEWFDKVITGGAPVGMLRWQTRNASVTKLKMGSWLFTPDIDWEFPVVVGSAHIFSVWAWCETGTFTTTPKIEWVGDDGITVISTSTGVQVTLTTTPQLLSLSATAPASASGARGMITNDGASASADVFVTRIGWGLGTVPVDAKTANGGPIIWKPVRFSNLAANPALPFGTNSGQRVVYSDFEIPPARPVLYRARNSVTSGVNLVSSPYSAYATVFAVPPVKAMLRSVTNPNLQASVNRRHMSSLSGRSSVSFHTDEDAQVYHPLGRDGGPVKIRDWVSGEDGELLLITVNEQQAARLANLLITSDVMQVQWAQGGRSYVLITARAYTEELHYFSWCDLDGQVISPYLRYDLYTLAYIETTAP